MKGMLCEFIKQDYFINRIILLPWGDSTNLDSGLWTQ